MTRRRLLTYHLFHEGVITFHKLVPSATIADLKPGTYSLHPSGRYSTSRAKMILPYSQVVILLSLLSQSSSPSEIWPLTATAHVGLCSIEMHSSKEGTVNVEGAFPK